MILRSRRVVTPAGTHPAAIRIESGRIAAVTDFEDIPAGASVTDYGNLAILPGLVDPHVHLNEPGRTEWEGIETGTRAAAAGGITTVVDMPLNSAPVTTTLAALDEKRAAASDRIMIDLGFHAGLIPGNLAEIEPLIDAGVMGVKAFLVHSGIDDFPNATEADLRAAMPILAERGVPLLVHCEIESCPAPTAKGARRYADYLASRPEAWEVEAIRMVLQLCEETGCTVHIVHLAAAEAVPILAEARARGLPVTVETAPHYLFFAAEDIPDGDTAYKCAPPIRGAANRELLWEALGSGIIDMIATDHSPCPPEMKGREVGDFGAAWGGISSLEVSLSAVWTEASRRGFSLDDIARWMALAPAISMSLAGIKGAILEGGDADLILFDPDADRVISGDELHQRHKLTPYAGHPLKGMVRQTYLRGTLIYVNGVFPAGTTGELLTGRHYD